MPLNMVSPQTRIPYQRSTSSSLNGMEISLQKAPPARESSSISTRWISNNTAGKPLPPIPRRPSSVYSQRDDEMNVMPESFVDENPLRSRMILQPSTYRSSTSKIPEPCLARPKLGENLLSHAFSDPIIERRRAQQGDLAELGIHSNQLLSQNPIADQNAALESKQIKGNEFINEMSAADKNADNYKSVLHSRFSTVAGFIPKPVSDYDYSPSPMSPRIIDVIDDSLIPLPLKYNRPEETSRPSSHFSSSSSELKSVHDSVRGALRSYARKAFHLQKSFDNRNKKLSRKSTSSLEIPNIISSTSRRGSRIGSIVNQRRASIQHGLSNMYDTLTNLSITSSKAKPALNITATKNARVPRALRSPAIPITPYQKLGRKAWEVGSTSSKVSRSSRSPKSPKPPKQRRSASRRSSNSQSRQPKDTNHLRHSAPATIKYPKPTSIVNKVASAFQSGTIQVESAMGLNTDRVKRTKSEVRREKLKKKITVIGIGDLSTGRTEDSNWF